MPHSLANLAAVIVLIGMALQLSSCSEKRDGDTSFIEASKGFEKELTSSSPPISERLQSSNFNSKPQRSLHRPRPLGRRPSGLAKHAALMLGSQASGEGHFMATTLIMLGRAWLWGGAALTLLAYGYVWWTEGFWQMEKSGIFSFSNGLEVFLVLAPGILLLILGRRLRARHEKFIRNFAESAAQRAADRSGTQANQ